MPSRRNRPARAALAGTALVVLAWVCEVPAAVAQAPLRDRVQVAVGPFLADSTLRLALAPDPAAVPQPLPAQAARGSLRESRRTLGWDVGVALGAHHALRVGGFRVDGEGAGSVTRLLQDEGREVVVDAAARGDLTLQSQVASWTWWTPTRDAQAFGIGLGVARYALRTRIDGVISVDGGPPGAGTARYAVDAMAPVLRLEYRRMLGARWRLCADFGWVRKPRGRLSGDATDAALGVEWLAGPNFGLAMRYTFADLDLRLQREVGTATLGIRNHGPRLLVTWRW